MILELIAGILLIPNASLLILIVGSWLWSICKFIGKFIGKYLGLAIYGRAEIERRLILRNESLLKEKFRLRCIEKGASFFQLPIYLPPNLIYYKTEYAKKQTLYLTEMSIYQDPGGFSVIVIEIYLGAAHQFFGIYSFNEVYQLAQAHSTSSGVIKHFHEQIRDCVIKHFHERLDGVLAVNSIDWDQIDLSIASNWFLGTFPQPFKRGPIRIILLNICLALAPFDLPPYVILEIVGCLPSFVDSRIPHGLKIKWIIAAKESIKRCWEKRFAFSPR